jgi:dTDP-4-dehydrorhamnose reductase
LNSGIGLPPSNRIKSDLVLGIFKRALNESTDQLIRKDISKLVEMRRPRLDTSSGVCSLDESHLPLLVTGVAGVAGYNAFYHFRERFGKDVIGIRRPNNWPLQVDGVVPCDADDPESVKRLFEKYQFKSVLNCGGSCALKACELDPVMAERVNVTSLSNILDAIKTRGSALIHLSIDLVYSGTGSGSHVESDLTDPVTVYGKTMVAAEQMILERLPSACILRISLPMGISFNNHAGAVDWIQSRFAKNKPATLYFDEVRTPTYVECLNETIEEIFCKSISGLFHAGARRKWSLYQIAQIVNRVGGYDPSLLIGCPRIEAGPIPPRAGDVTMDSQKLYQRLGRIPFKDWPINENFMPTSPDWHLETSNWAGNPQLIFDQLYLRPR